MANHKEQNDELREMIMLHQYAMKHLLKMIKKRGEKEIRFWGSLRKNLEEVK
jgi:Ni,Fe-hydrogenase maturation factor